MHLIIAKSVKTSLFIILLTGPIRLTPTNSNSNPNPNPNKQLDSNTVMWGINDHKVPISSPLQNSNSASSSGPSGSSGESTAASLLTHYGDSNDTESLKEQILMLEFIKVQILNKLGMNEAPKIGSEKLKINACKLNIISRPFVSNTLR